MSYKYKSQFLEKLGVRSWINAKNWSTVIGGTWIDDRVLDVMNEVAKTFVDMHNLFEKADSRIAELCGVEEAHITCGTGAALELSVAACMAGDDYGAWMQLPKSEGLKNEVVLPRGHNIAYTPQWTASGANLVEYGQAGSLGSMKAELKSAITDETCCVGYIVSYNVVPRGVIPLEEVLRISHDSDLPVIVDAASMLPPVGNLDKYTDLGADVVCFSGGKAIKAPNNTGFILGNGRGAEIIRNVRSHTFPHYGWGRGHKISKEQIAGLVKALEIFIDEGDGLYDDQMEKAEYMSDELGQIAGLDVCVIPNDEQFHEHVYTSHVPRVLIQWDKEEKGLTGDDLDDILARGETPIFLRKGKYYNYFTNREWRQIDTFYLRDDEVNIVLNRLRDIFND